MGTERIAAIVAASGKQTETKQSAGGQAPQLAELQYLEQTIKKMENDYQSKARSQGVSSVEIQSKVRSFESLISKVDEQIAELQRAGKNGSASSDKEVVSSLHYSTAASMVALRTSGQSIHTVLSQTTQAIQQKAQQAQEQARKAERIAQEEHQAESIKSPDSASLNVLA